MKAQQVACIGAGNVGRAWAVVFARAGYKVALFDVSQEEIAQRALPHIQQTLAMLDDQQLLQEPVSDIVARIQVAPSIEIAVSEAVYVQESVREDPAIKRQVLSTIAAAAPASALLASSTSAIKGSEFLTHIPGPERALVAHPVNPPSLIPLVELCPTPVTSPESLSSCRQLMKQAGMKPITVRKEIEGFVLNRLQYTLVAEAMHLVAEGYCSPEDIDRVMTDGLALRWASMGPFEVAHLNATEGFKGFVAQLGTMMKTVGRSARTDYDWDDRVVDDIHQAMARRTPVSEIPARQAWRDRQINALQKLKRTND